MGMSFSKAQYEKSVAIWASRSREITMALGMAFYMDTKHALEQSAKEADMLSILNGFSPHSLLLAQEYELIDINHVNALKACELAYRCIIRIRTVNDEDLYELEELPRWLDGMMRGNRSKDSFGLDYQETY